MSDPFKRVHGVSIKKPGGGHNMIRPEAWLNYRLTDRVRLIKEGCVEFVDPRGDRIPMRDALKDLARIGSCNGGAEELPLVGEG
jgi:hypothetical protein